MQRLNFPEYSFNIQEKDNKYRIFDIARKKFVALTGEEWVRQHVIRYLNEEKSVPLGLISIEAGLNLYKTFKRYDISVFDRDAKPVLIVECKSPEVAIDRKVIEQALRYNLVLKVNYILLTNGLTHICLKFDAQEEKWKNLTELPTFSQLISRDIL